jgi:curved DNA-binding protein CbpA
VRNRSSVLAKSVEASRRAKRKFDRVVNLYRVLGLRPGADGKKIKTAYVRLIKQVHPDFNAGDAQAEQLTKELNRAYQTLRKADTRAAYDTELARHHTVARRRFLQSMATGVAAFLMTVGLLIPSATFLKGPKQENPRWQTTEAYAPAKKEQIYAKSNAGSESVHAREPSSSFPEPLTTSPHLPQREYRVPIKEATPPSRVREGDKGAAPPLPREKGAGLLSSALAVPAEARVPAIPLPEGPPRIAAAIPAPPHSVREQTAPSEPVVSPMPGVAATRPTTWAVYRNAHLGFALKYPGDVFTLGRNQTDNTDRLLTSKDGRALLRIFGIPNRMATTLTQYRRALIARRYPDATFDYTFQQHNWFVLSGRVGEEMFYEHVTLSCDGRSIHGWLLVYPIAERSLFDEIGEEIHRTYRYDIGANPRCGQSSPPRAFSAGTRKPSVTADMAQFE